MTDFEVNVDDEFKVDCPLRGQHFCGLEHIGTEFTNQCSFCSIKDSSTSFQKKLTGIVKVHVEGETTVNIEMPERGEDYD